MNSQKFIIIEVHQGIIALEKRFVKESKLIILSNKKIPPSAKINTGKIAHIKKAVHKISAGCSSNVSNKFFKYDILV